MQKKLCKCGSEIKQITNSTIKPKLCTKCTTELKSSTKIYKRTTFKTKRPKTSLKSKNAKSKKSIEKQLDIAWSLAVKKKGGMKCEVCGLTTTLNSHHIFSRAKKSVRWDLDNGICLCVNHHVGFQFSAHKSPVSFVLFLITKRGQNEMNILTAKANSTAHPHLFELQMKLRDLNVYLESF